MFLFRPVYLRFIWASDDSFYSMVVYSMVVSIVNVCVHPSAAGVAVPPPGVDALHPWDDPHGPSERRGPEEHRGVGADIEVGLHATHIFLQLSLW